MFDFTINGNSLIVTNTTSGEVVFDSPKRDYYFGNRELNQSAPSIQLYDTGGAREVEGLYFKCLISDATIEGVAASLSNVREFMRTNLGGVTEGSTLTDKDPLIAHAINVISSTYGDTVSVSQKQKDLLKFGRNPNVGTARATIWYTGQDETEEATVAANTNPIDTLSCSDVLAASVLQIQGHTMTAGVKTFVIQTATQDGRNKVTLDTPLHHVTRVAHNDDDALNLLGETYIYEDTGLTNGKPTDTTKIHLTTPDGENQSQKASTALSSVDYWIVTGISAGYVQKSGSNTAEVTLETRKQGGVWKPLAKPLVMATGDSDQIKFEPYKIIPKDYEVRLSGLASAASQSLVADIQGFLASIVV